MLTARISAFYRRHSLVFFTTCVFLILMYILFFGDNVGLSNNGDFQRVLDASSVKIIDMDYAFLYEDTYTITLKGSTLTENIKNVLFSADGIEDYPSVHLVFSRISVVINLIINYFTGSPLNTFNVSVLGVINVILYTLALAFLFSQLKFANQIVDFLVKTLIVIIMCDIGYAAYLQSFYGEALEHICLIFVVASLIRLCKREFSIADILISFISILFYGWSKFFNLPLGVVLVFVSMGIVAFRHRRVLLPLLLSIVGVVIFGAIYLNVPTWMDTATNYNGVFYGILYDVDEETAASYLSDMSLPEKMADYRTTNFYISWVGSKLYEDSLIEHVNSLSKVDILKFYLTHPHRLAEVLPTIAGHCGMVRPFYLSNHDSSHPRMELSDKFSLWSIVRPALPFDTVWGTVLLLLTFVLLILCRFKPSLGKGSVIIISFGTLALCAYAFLFSFMSNGMGDLAKHQFPFVELMDIVFIAVVALIANELASRQMPQLVTLSSLICIFVFLFTLPSYNALLNLQLQSRTHDFLEEGAYVTLGNYNGNSIKWLVVSSDDASATLLSVDKLDYLPYDTTASNDWSSSSIRSYLNSDFKAAFSADEYNLLIPCDNKVICNSQNLTRRDSGSIEFLCSHLPAMCHTNYPVAYSYHTKDYITLPDIDLISALYNKGYDIGADYWLETVYAPNSYMTRYISRDSFVSFAQSDTLKGIRPVINISFSYPIDGDGSLNNPFVLTN